MPVVLLAGALPLVSAQNFFFSAEQLSVFGPAQLVNLDWYTYDNEASYGVPTEVNTSVGILTGRLYPDGDMRFYGIKVGETTGGENRFKPAIPLATRMDQTTTVERQCPWLVGQFGTEDCVSVDIVTNTALDKAPIACWIHGGGFANIDYATPGTRATSYYPESGVVLAALHYRMGFLGWGWIAEAATELVNVPGVGETTGFSGNYGATDIIVELMFIKENADKFGGDAEKINIFGESAGGAFVTSLMAMPFIGTLVKGAIMQSPFIAMGDGAFSCVAKADQADPFMSTASWMAAAVTGNTPDTSLAALRAVADGAVFPGSVFPAGSGIDLTGLPATVAFLVGNNLYDTSGNSSFDINNNGGFNYGPFQPFSPWFLANYAQFFFWPCADGMLMPQAPGQAFAGGINPDVAVMVGHNTDELITFYKSGADEFNLWPGYVNPNGSPANNPFPSNRDENRSSAALMYNIGDQALILGLQRTTSSSTFGEIYEATMTASEELGFLPLGSTPTGYEELYGGITDPVSKLVQASTDSYLSATTSSIVDTLTSSSSRTAGTYRYLFAQGNPDWFAERQPGWGACHGCELTYVLGLYESGLTYPMASTYNRIGINDKIPFTPGEIQVGTAMKAYWVNFFMTGDPNLATAPSSDRRLQAGLPVWQPATAADMNVMVFNEGYAAGAELNPCVMTTNCARVPAKDWKIAESTFWKTGATGVAKPVCTAEPSNVMSLKFTAETFACRVIAFDDPHFLVGHGDRFDYKGKDMTVYNLLSHTNVSVNALFTHADFVASSKEVQRLVHGSFMRELYATVKTNTSRLLTVEFSVYTSAVVRVSADGSPAAMVRPGQVKRFDDVQVELAGRTAKITTPEWVVDAKSKVKPSIVGATKCADGRCTLNVAVSPRFDTANTRVAPHGLMGQSYDGDSVAVIGAVDKYKGDEVSTSAMGEGAIEGVAKDYEMADKFGTRFAFSRFGKASAAPRNVSALSGMKVKANPASVEAKAADDVFVD